MQFDLSNPLNGLSELNTKIWDSHVHIWSVDAFEALLRTASKYGVRHFMGIAAPDVKKTLSEAGYEDIIHFGYYLPIDAFAKHEPERILKAIEEAHSENYSMVKLWFGPRFLDFFEAEKIFSINLPIFSPAFALIEEYGIPMDIHVADPDIWYVTKYQNEVRYRSKEQAMIEFREVLKTFKDLKTISIHFNSLPENLKQVSRDLNAFPNLYIDTASTKWMVRELGKNIELTRTFFKHHYKRILFATDLSVGWEDRDEEYLSTRYWAQRIFWESDYQKLELPFPDEDNPSPPTYINGLNLSKDILEHFYWKNAEKFFHFQG